MYADCLQCSAFETGVRWTHLKESHCEGVGESRRTGTGCSARRLQNPQLDLLNHHRCNSSILCLFQTFLLHDLMTQCAHIIAAPLYVCTCISLSVCLSKSLCSAFSRAQMWG